MFSALLAYFIVDLSDQLGNILTGTGRQPHVKWDDTPMSGLGWNGFGFARFGNNLGGNVQRGSGARKYGGGGYRGFNRRTSYPGPTGWGISGPLYGTVLSNGFFGQNIGQGLALVPPDLGYGGLYGGNERIFSQNRGQRISTIHMNLN